MTLQPLVTTCLLTLATAAVLAQAPDLDWKTIEAETLGHFQSIVKIETTDPPGNERPAAEYLKQVLDKAGIETKVFELEPNQAQCRCAAEGKRDQAPASPDGAHRHRECRSAKWTFPPFSAARDGGYVYGRGTVDDKDNVAAGADDHAAAEAARTCRSIVT